MTKIKIEKLPDGAHRTVGEFDSAKRWYPTNVPSSLFDVRSPSKAHPYSYLRHLYTGKFAAKLFWHDPRLYLNLQGLTMRHKKAKELIAMFTAKKMGVGHEN
jgi:hypothetical protein